MSQPIQLFNLTIGDTFAFIHNDPGKVFSILSISDSGEILVEQVYPSRAYPQRANIYAWVRHAAVPQHGGYFQC
jgi:hypothetical protein